MIEREFEALLELAIEEDLGAEGDISSKSVFKDETAEAVLIAKADGVICGRSFFERVHARIDHATEVSFDVDDGDRVSEGECVASVKGKVLSLLTAERISLNFLCFLSGIATATRECVDEAARTGKAIILDTRKTLPGYRELSKYAVRVGGGSNHRMGLYDMIMLKDNHIDACGSIKAAVERVRAAYGRKYRIEVECRTLEDVRQAVETGVDVIMLDNMDNVSMATATKVPREGVKFEASGNMRVDRIASVSATGVDFISIGAITHSAKALDFSLKIRGGSRQ